MRKVSEKNYRYYIPWAEENTANTVYPCSIAEGFQSGDICPGQGQYCDSEKGLKKKRSQYCEKMIHKFGASERATKHNIQQP